MEQQQCQKCFERDNGLVDLIVWVDELQDTAEQNMKEFKAQEQQFYGVKLACLEFKEKLKELLVS